MSEVRYTYCQICEQCCGLAATVDNGRIVDIQPDQNNPYSWRDFCVKGAKAHEVVYHPRRITTPMRRVGDHYEPATYEEAIADIAKRMRKTMAEHGSDATGAYSGSPHACSFSSPTFLSPFLSALPTHNYYFASSVDTQALHVAAQHL